MCRKGETQDTGAGTELEAVRGWRPRGERPGPKARQLLGKLQAEPSSGCAQPLARCLDGRARCSAWWWRQ